MFGDRAMHPEGHPVLLGRDGGISQRTIGPLDMHLEGYSRGSVEL
jgi:hypothetical protein